ncbi:MAG: hypothetical protein ABUS57_12585 [Pseudomonadota bacterium]
MAIPVAYQLGGSVAVIALMVGMAALLGFRKTTRIADQEALQRLAADAEPDARIAASVIAANGKSALARLADGRVLLARSMGEDVTLRFLKASALRLRLKGDRLTARFGDIGFPALNMRLKDAPPAWLQELAKSQGG